MKAKHEVLNYVDNQWQKVKAAEFKAVYNPATGELLAETPLAGADAVNQAVQSAAKAFESWRRVPTGERIQYLFELKDLMEFNLEDIARTITLECGKTLDESRGELRRAIENVEVACGMPMMMQGAINEDIARGIDEFMIRQPLGVGAAICPFNFPAMIAFWFMPYAIAAGNTYIIKPSERVPLTMQKLFGLFEQINLPAGVVNMVNGASGAVDALLDHPGVKAVSFVGSTTIARYIYARAAANGKRAQCQGGAKNPVVIMPDADLDTAIRIIGDSAFGCAGQRCAAVSLVMTVGDAQKPFTEAMVQASAARTVGDGLQEGIMMGPVISDIAKERIENTVEEGIKAGARVELEGRDTVISGYEGGYFIKPTILSNVMPENPLARTELFGPVVSMTQVNTLEEAIGTINRGNYGNMACIFTASGAAARKFRNEVEAGDIGINIGIAAPMAYFPFSGWKDSFFGDMHGQAMDAVEFFTQKKVVVERWPKEWSRKF